MKDIIVALVVGEPSGDVLGSQLMRALRNLHPNIAFTGIAGPQMIAEGCNALFPMEKIHAFGLIEVAKHLPRILTIRHRLVKTLLKNPPDLYIGIDAPDFNLSVERRLKQIGIKTVHYNSPTVWAWRENRIYTIAKAVDLMLLLFPFEKAIYQKHQIPAQFIGHPLADSIPMTSDKFVARHALGLSVDSQVIALLPGSRHGEITRLTQPFLQTAANCLAYDPTLTFIAAMANPACRKQFEHIYADFPTKLPLTIIDGQAQRAIAAADIVLLASGTATLEAMLVKRPMVVAYKGAEMSYQLAKRLVKIRQFSFPNLLAGEVIVPEFIQDAANADNLTEAVLDYLQDADKVAKLCDRFKTLHNIMQQNASEKAARAVLKLI